MGKLERDGFGEANQILYKLLLHWRHTYYIRYSRSSCQIWAVLVFVPGNIQGHAIAGVPWVPALPDILECLSNVGGPGGQNVSSVGILNT